MQRSPYSHGVCPLLGSFTHSPMVAPENKNWSQHTAPFSQSMLSSQRSIPDRLVLSCFKVAWSQTSLCVLSCPILLGGASSGADGKQTPSLPDRQQVSLPERHVLFPHANRAGSEEEPAEDEGEAVASGAAGAAGLAV